MPLLATLAKMWNSIAWWKADNERQMRIWKAKSIRQRLNAYNGLKKEALETVMSNKLMCPASLKSVWASLEVYDMLMAQLNAELEQLEKTL